MDVLQNHVCQRIAYAESAVIGSTVIEEPMKDPLAAQEISSLTEEILEKYSR
jgi:chromosome partitioning protein